MYCLVGSEESLDNFGSNVAGCVIGVDVKGKGNDGVDANAHGAFKVVALSVLDQVVDDENGDEEDHGLETLEVKGHGLVHDPAENDKEGRDEEGDLHRGTDGDVDSEVHLALVCNNNSGYVFGGIANDGNQN